MFCDSRYIKKTLELKTNVFWCFHDNSSICILNENVNLCILNVKKNVNVKRKRIFGVPA